MPKMKKQQDMQPEATASKKKITSKNLLLIPDKGTPYWYIRSMAKVKSFEVATCLWNNWTSDHYRYVRGNVFLDQRSANSACQALNVMLSKLD